MLKRFALVPIIALLASSSVMAAMAAQDATPETDTDIERHLAWIIGLFETGAGDLTEAEVEAHFDDTFLTAVPANEFIETIRIMQGSLGSLELVEDQSASAAPGEYSGLYRAESGDLVVVTLAVDPASGLMSGFFITPGRAASSSSPVAIPAGTPTGTPVASPVAAVPMVGEPEAQLALYDAKVEAIREVGEPVVSAVVGGDVTEAEQYLSPEVLAALDNTSLADVIDSFTIDQVTMTFAEADVHFFGQWQHDQISGIMIQQGQPIPFTLTADESQAGELPTGHWSGSLAQVGLEFEITFDADAGGALAATLSIPVQGLSDAPLSNVRYQPEVAIGDPVDDRAFGPGGGIDSYTADFAWGDALLRVVVGIDVEAGQAMSVQVMPAIPTPAPTGNAPVAAATYALPFAGTWWVFWGGETELHNYHAAVSSQRYAYDLLIWNDGATFTSDGARNEDYWVWGQPVLAPSDGTVVEVVNDDVDQPPQRSGQAGSQPSNPGGNHVVLETAEGEYVFIAHMQQGSIQVAAGDTVETGDQLGLTGNSGSTSEPHVHIHIQDSPDILDFDANGIPLRFADIEVNGEAAQDVLPLQGSFVANP